MNDDNLSNGRLINENKFNKFLDYQTPEKKTLNSVDFAPTAFSKDLTKKYFHKIIVDTQIFGSFEDKVDNFQTPIKNDNPKSFSTLFDKELDKFSKLFN